MAVSDGETITVVKDMGLVSNAFDDRTLAALTGHLAIGHDRYSTTGSSNWRNAQPVYRDIGAHTFALGPQRQPGQHRGAGRRGRHAARRHHQRQRPGGRAAGRRAGPQPRGQLRRPGPRAGPARGAAHPRGRLLVRADGRGPHRRGARSARVPPAVPGQARQRLGAGVGEPGARRGRRALRPRARAGRDGHHRRRRATARCGPSPTGQVEPKLCLFEFVYFARPDSHPLRPERAPGPGAHGRGAGRPGAGRGRPGHGGARVGHARGRGLRPRAAASPTARAWSRTATSAAPSSPPTRRCGPWACA